MSNIQPKSYWHDIGLLLLSADVDSHLFSLEAHGGWMSMEVAFWALQQIPVVCLCAGNKNDWTVKGGNSESIRISGASVDCCSTVKTRINSNTFLKSLKKQTNKQTYVSDDTQQNKRLPPEFIQWNDFLIPTAHSHEPLHKQNKTCAYLLDTIHK